MRTPPRGSRAVLAVILALALAAGCKGDKDDKAPAGPAAPGVEGTSQPDPEALRSAVDLAVERALADAQADRIGGKDHGDAARIRTLEARQARLEERLDALERMAAVGGPSRAESGRDAPPTVDPDPDPEPESAPETPPTVEPEPESAPETPPTVAPEPDVVEAPEVATDEQALGFHPAPPAEDGAEPGLVLARAAVAPSIDRDAREPVDEGTVFDASVGNLYAFLVFKNPTEDEQRVTVVWTKNGKELSRLPDLKIGPKASRWRTWASVTINERRRGDWSVEVLGPEDVSLGLVRFTVE